MNKIELTAEISRKNSFLCVGLDTDVDKLPDHLKGAPDSVFEFNRQIIDATKDYCVAYKINTAFYESQGLQGWISLEKTLKYIPDTVFKIADAKRGDIGNTAEHYAKTFFETYPFDAVTLNAYMGGDTIRPFLKYKDKWVILLALTSNAGAEDFEMLNVGGRKLFEEVLVKSSQWGTDENMMYVAGATRPEAIGNIRKIIPNHFLLVPGVGAQGGDLQKISEYGLNDSGGLLVNASRSIIFASKEKDFAEAAAREALALQKEMAELLEAKVLKI